MRDDSIDGNGYLAAESSQHATTLSLTDNQVKPTAGIELLQGLLRIIGLVFLGRLRDVLTLVPLAGLQMLSSAATAIGPNHLLHPDCPYPKPARHVLQSTGGQMGFSSAPPCPAGSSRV
jgi:hypothetical protein